MTLMLDERDHPTMPLSDLPRPPTPDSKFVHRHDGISFVLYLQSS